MQLKTAQANYNAATAQVEQAKAALGSSKINANFTLIKAPVSGYIGRILIVQVHWYHLQIQQH